MTEPRIRVASVPATHVYVRRLEHPDVDRRVDPSGDDRRTPCFLDPDWWAREAACSSVDVLHVHFGFEYYSAQQLDRVCDQVHRFGGAVVYTCHDLRNPNHATPGLHDEGLRVLLRQADEVLTLTPWAAEQLRTRWGRTATVAAHPHVVPLVELHRRARPPRRRHPDRYRFGLHLKSMRANMFDVELVRAALAALATIEGAQLEVHLHHDVLDASSPSHRPELVGLLLSAASDAESRLDLQVHHYLSDDQLWDAIAGVDAFILPYRFGTHSGLLEACRDLGTAVLAPACGGYVDQGADHVFALRPDGDLDDASFAAAMRAAVVAGRPEPVAVEARQREREQIAEAHVEVYRRALRARQGRSAG